MKLIVKAGGNVLDKNLNNLLNSLAKHSKNNEIVFVHGGGNIVTEYSRRFGIEPKFVISPSGVRSRYTDEKELEIYVMVMAGKINKEIVGGLLRRGVKAIGLSGVDGKLLYAKRKERIIIIDERGRKRFIPGGYTGKIINVNVDLLNNLLNEGFLVVVAPIAYGTNGELLNVDGDQAAAIIAKFLKPHRLILLSDVRGVMLEGKILSKIKAFEVQEVFKKIGLGMNRKILMAAEAVQAGVEKAIISSGLTEDPVGDALKEEGTVIE